MNYKEYELGELLSYEQPTPYIVKTTEYNDTYAVPVLTAGKSFVLGYTNETNGVYDKLPVIIFDDFTTASKYVNFKFKVKSSAMKILTPNTERVLPKYIYYLMQAINFDASTHKRYWIQQYSKIKVSIPSLPEQERIVSRIEELFSQLDAGVETLKKTKAQLEVYRQAVLKEAFSEKDGYREVKVSEIGEVNLGRQRSPKNVSNNYPTKYIRAANITEQGFKLDDILEMEFTPKEREKYYLRSGDILISEASGSAKQVGKPALWKNEIENCCFQNTVIRHRLHSELPEYVYWYYKYLYYSGYFSKIVGGVGINHLGANNFSDIALHIAPIIEQQKIVREIEEKISACANIEKTVDEALQQAEAMRQSILKHAFDGSL